MATQAKEKVPVDHSAISGPTKTEEPPKSDFLATMERVAADPASATPAPAKSGIMGMITSGREMAPPRIFLAGTEGIGKSTFASKAPKPIFIPSEDGLKQIECDKFPVAKTFGQVRTYVQAVASEKHDYQTIAIDTVDWTEHLIWDSVAQRYGKKSIEDIGYAKGYIYALDEWRELLDLLERCHARGMAVILLSHTKIEKFEDPDLPTYDRFSPRLHKHAQALLTEWADAVLFAKVKMTVKDASKGDSRQVAVPVGAGGGERVIKTIGSPTCVAKNRYNLPAEIPLSWDAFNAGFNAFYNSPSAKNVA